jgi:hypothetical protein
MALFLGFFLMDIVDFTPRAQNMAIKQSKNMALSKEE